MRVLYLGTPEFVVPPLVRLREAGHEVVAVVSAPPRPAGRGRQPADPPLALAARAAGLTVLQPEKASAPDFLARLAPLAVDVAVTAAYGQYLSSSFLALPRHGVLNIHPSLLPRWRGASPVMSALLAGDPVTGVTVLRSTKKMDAGPILAQRRVEPAAHETAGELTERLFRLGAELLLEVLERLAHGPVPGEPQDETQATTCTKVTREMAEIRWEAGADTIARMVRAFNPAPVAWTTLEGRTLRIWRARAAAAGEEGAGAGAAGARPGTLLGPPLAPAPLVVCGQGTLLLDEVQLEGSRRMPALQAWRGLRLRAGQALLVRADRPGPEQSER